MGLALCAKNLTHFPVTINCLKQSVYLITTSLYKHTENNETYKDSKSVLDIAQLTMPDLEYEIKDVECHFGGQGILAYFL